AISAAIEPDIQVAVPGDFDARNAVDRRARGGKFRSGNLGRLLQLAGELECGRNGDLAEARFFGLLGLYGYGDSVQSPDSRRELLRDLFFKRTKHDFELRTLARGGALESPVSQPDDFVGSARGLRSHRHEARKPTRFRRKLVRWSTGK